MNYCPKQLSQVFSPQASDQRIDFLQSVTIMRTSNKAEKVSYVSEKQQRIIELMVRRNSMFALFSDIGSI